MNRKKVIAIVLMNMIMKSLNTKKATMNMKITTMMITTTMNRSMNMDIMINLFNYKILYKKQVSP